MSGCGINNSAVSGGFTWGELRAWNPTTGEPRRHPTPASPRAHALAACPDGRSFLTWPHVDQGQRWDLAQGWPLGKPLADHGVHAAAYSPDGKTLLTGSTISTDSGWRATWRLWESRTGEPRSERRFRFDVPEKVPGRVSAVHAVAWRGDSRAFLTVAGGMVRLWRADTGEPLGKPILHHDRVGDALFSPDGRLVLARFGDNTARFYDAATGKPHGPPLPHTEAVQAMTFSPDGRTVATAGGTLSDRLEKQVMGFVQFWDVATGKPLGGPLRHRKGVTAIYFRPDGKALLSACRDGTARLWQVPEALEGDAAQLMLWAEARSGLRLDEHDVVVPLSDAEWLERRKRLGEE